MKKRILAMFMAVVALVSCFVLSVGAEEETIEEAAVFSMVDDEEPEFQSYYYFTLWDGEAITYPDIANIGASASVKTSYYMVATNGKFHSGKDAGDYDISVNCSTLYLKSAPSYNQVFLGSGNTYNTDTFLVKFAGGNVSGIAGCLPNVNKGALYDSLYVKIGCGYWDGDVYVDTTEEVEAFVKELEALGVEVKKSTYGGIVETIFDGFGAAIGGLAGGLKLSFNRILYANGVGGAFSPLVIFVFVMAGLGLATGILYKIFGMIRARKG